MGFGGDQQVLARDPTPRTDLSNSSRQCFTSLENLSIQFDIRSKSDKGSETKEKEKKSWWQLRPFSFWPFTKQQEDEEKEVEKVKVSSRAGSETKEKEKKSYWALRPFSFWPSTKQQEDEEKEGKVSSRAGKKRS